MRELARRVAVVTGGASGIGRALGARLAAEGARLVLADVEKAALDAAVAELASGGAQVQGVVADVSDAGSVQALADRVWEIHGACHLLVNNAGIGTDETRTPVWASSPNDWAWALRVNLWGALHGIRAFVPRMLADGEEGRVVNTSSGNGGLFPLPTTPIYATTKAALTCLTEVLHHQLRMAGARLGASVLFPGPHVVNTRIFDAARNRPADLPMETDPDAKPPSLEDLRRMAEQAGFAFRVTEPEEVAAFAVEGIREGRFWLLPASEETDARVRARMESILAREDPPSPFG